MKNLVLFHGQRKLSWARRVLLLLFLGFFFLSPYLDFGGLKVNTGIIAALVFFALYWHIFMKVVFRPAFLLLTIPLVALTLYSSLVAATHGFSPFSIFTQAVIKLILYTAVGFVLALYFANFHLREGDAFELLLRLALYIVFINSVVAILLFSNPDVRSVVESFLYYDESMNINYRNNDFRMRGIASSGGAALSVFHGLGIVISAWLFIFRKIGGLFFVTTCFFIACSMLVIGRSGIIVVIFCLPFLLTLAYINSYSFQRKRAIALVFIVGLAVVLMPVLAWFLLPKPLFDYAIGFLYGGVSGIQEEGTVAIIASFYQFPLDVYKLLAGMGDYSGAFAAGATADPGYMKTATALGIPLAAFFYVLILIFSVWITLRRDCSHFQRGFVILLMTALLFVEIKEPFFLEGYAARFFWLITGMTAYHFIPRYVIQTPSQWMESKSV